MSGTFRVEDRIFWENWLPPDLGDRLSVIRELVTHLFQTTENESHLKYFIPHGKDHCQAVEDNMHRLIPCELHKKLSGAEKFFLLSSAWLHDIGMIRGIFPEDAELKDDRIRELHHIRTEKYIVDQYSNIGINETEASAFRLLSRFHRRRCEILECPEYVYISLHGTIRLRLLAAYLRLAVALDFFTYRPSVLRAEELPVSSMFDIPMKSNLPFLKKRFVIGMDIDTDKSTITLHFKKFPYQDMQSTERKAAVHATLVGISSFIAKDLRNTLDTTMNTLVLGGISYFLTVEIQYQQVALSIEECQRQLEDIEGFINYYKLLNTPSGKLLLNIVANSIKKNTSIFNLLEETHPESVNFSRILELLVLASKQLFSIPEPSNKTANVPVWLKFEYQPWAADVSIALRSFEEFSAMLFACNYMLAVVSQLRDISELEREKITSLLGNPIKAMGLEQRIRVQEVFQGSIYFKLGTLPRNIWKKMESLFNFIPLCRKTIAEAKKAEAEAKKIEAEGDKIKAETMIMVLKEQNNIMIENEREKDLSEERIYKRLKHQLNIIKQVLDLARPEQRHLPEEAVMALLNRFIDTMDQTIVAEDIGHLVDLSNSAKREPP